MNGQYYYQCYGLNFSCEFPLPEIKTWEASKGQIDVDIHYGTLDEKGLGEDTQCGPFLWISGDVTQLNIPDVAKFRISHGTKITVDPMPGIDLESVRVFLLGSAFGVLLFQRGYLVMHGNSVRIGEGCIICVGHSGAGKSTLAAAFMQRGYDLLADDVVPVDAHGRAITGFPRIKLWKDAAEKLGIETTGLKRIRPDMEKFNLPISPPDMALHLPVKAIYILQQTNNDKISLTPISGFKKFNALKAHTYRLRFMQNMALQPQHLTLCSQLAGQAHMRLVERGKIGFEIDALVDTILNDAKKATNMSTG